MSKQRLTGESSDVNIPQERRDLLNDVQRVLRVAFLKFENERTQNSQRQAWGRLIVNGVAAAGALVKDSDLDDLLRRIEKLEEMKNE